MWESSKSIESFNNNSIFISRGDDSGTHKKALELWDSINIDVNKLEETIIQLKTLFSN